MKTKKPIIEKCKDVQIIPHKPQYISHVERSNYITITAVTLVFKDGKFFHAALIFTNEQDGIFWNNVKQYPTK